MKTRISVFLACFLMIFSVAVLSACGNDMDEQMYPEIEDVTVPENAEEVSYDGFTGKYDPDKWVFGTQLNIFTLYDRDDYEMASDSMDNVTVVVSSDYEGPFTEEDMNSIMDAVVQAGGEGFEIVKSELRTFAGETVIYYESKTTINDAMIDLLIQQGSIAEEQIEALGGREALIDMGTSDQVGIYAIIDGKAVVFTGTYTDDPNGVLEAMKVLIKTGKVS